MRRWLKRQGIPARDRSDVCQEVILAAWRSFRRYDPDRARLERWLNKITFYIAARYADRAVHRREELTADDLLAEAVDERLGAEEQIEAREARLLVLELLGEIEPGAAAVLIAHRLDGIPMAEIAEQRGLPVSTAYKWQARAMAELREVLSLRRCEEEP